MVLRPSACDLGVAVVSDGLVALPEVMPTFGVLDLPWTADGGPDGTRLLQDCMTRLRLAPQGRIPATAMVAGDETRLELDWLQGLTESRDWRTLVVPAGYHDSRRAPPSSAGRWSIRAAYEVTVVNR